MLKTKKIKLRRVLNELKYLYDELSLIEDMCTAASSKFEQHYRAFCAQNDINLKNLNEKNADRLQDVYNVEEIAQDVPSSLSYSGSSQLVIHSSPDMDEDVCIPEDDVLYKDLHVAFNKVFKKLAMKLHPDRIENHILDNDQKFILQEDFRKARRCLEKKQYFHLLQLAHKYEVYVPENYGLQLKWFRKERDRVRADVTQEKTTYNYNFAECEDDDQRDDLIRAFLKQLFNINI